LTASVLEFTYSDKASKESDELTLKCHDRENDWIGNWYPKKTVEKVLVEKPVEYKKHTVTSGDTLGAISTVYLGTFSRWHEIVEVNPQLAGRRTAIDGSPLIYVGDVLTIPEKVPAPAEQFDNAVPGAILRAAICVENWDFEGDNRELDCGSFEIDSVDLSWPPCTVTIKALSIPISSSIRNSEKTRAWEDITLQKIAQDIADDAGLELMYEIEGDIQLDRVDQEEKSDMGFLLELCLQYGVALKVTDNKVILFEEAAYEAKPVIDTFDKKETGDGGRIVSYSFSQDTSGTVCKVIASYKDPKSGKLVQSKFEPPEPPATGQIAYVNTRPGDLSGDDFREGNDTSLDASGGTFNTGFNAFNDITADFNSPRLDRTDNSLRLAKAVARERNKNEWTCTLRIRGNLNMVGSVNIGVIGFGVYSGKYSVFDVSHSLGNKFETTIKARRVLVGY
jgi:phage protein D